MNFSSKLQAARLALNLSIEQLSALTNISVKSLIAYEQKNVIPKQTNLKKLAKSLNVSMYYLTHDDENNPNANKDKEIFFDEVRTQFGQRAQKEAQTVFEQTNTLFAGGSINDDAQEVFEQALMMVYMDSKANAKKKYTPKKFQTKKSD